MPNLIERLARTASASSRTSRRDIVRGTAVPSRDPQPPRRDLDTLARAYAGVSFSRRRLIGVGGATAAWLALGSRWPNVAWAQPCPCPQGCHGPDKISCNTPRNPHSEFSITCQSPGAGHCCPTGTTCCSSALYADPCCMQGYVCTDGWNCCQDGQRACLAPEPVDSQGIRGGVCCDADKGCDPTTGNCCTRCRPQKGTGHGYDKLNGEFKAALQRLYAILDDECACYHFTVGFRSETGQQDLYDRWHKIGDHQQDNKHLCEGLQGHGSGVGPLKANHFAQCPKGWTKNGIAKGGPAKPKKSNHESAMAADIDVLWPPDYEPDVERFRAAAIRAGLCGPPDSDPVHVELPLHQAARDGGQMSLHLTPPRPLAVPNAALTFGSVAAARCIPA